MSRTELNADTIYVYIQTYELGKDYLIRALDSIRNQTYTNFKCFVYDNCSGEEVRAKLQEYVKADERFSLTYFDNTAGHTIAWEYGIPEIIHMAGDKGGYYFRLDADDELELDCFEKMIAYMTNNNLDMVASASLFIDANTMKVVGIRGTQADFVLEGDLFDRRFPEYYQIMRTHWAKLYKIDVMKRMNLSNLKITTYGGDTLFVREALLKSKRVGILSRPLYKYYMYSNERDYNLERRRMEAPRILLERDFSFLLQKCGNISTNTMAWLLNVYLQENDDVFKLIIKGQNNIEQKIEDIYSVLSAIPFRLAMRLGAKEKLGYLYDWLLRQNVFENKETITKVAEIFSILGVIPDRIPNKGNADYFRFLVKMYDFWDNYDSKAFLETNIMECVHNSLLLQSHDFYYCRFNADIVEAVLRENYAEAYKRIKKIVRQKHYFDGQFIGKHVELGLNVTAILEDESEYAYMSKRKIELLINEDLPKALVEVNEWIELLPDDEELIKFKKQIVEKKGGISDAG